MSDTLKRAEIVRLRQLRDWSMADIMSMGEHKRGTPWHLDRVREVTALDQALTRLGAIGPDGWND